MSLRKRAAWILYSKISNCLLDGGYVPGTQTCYNSEKILEGEGQKHRAFRSQFKEGWELSKKDLNWHSQLLRENST